MRKIYLNQVHREGKILPKCLQASRPQDLLISLTKDFVFIHLEESDIYPRVYSIKNIEYIAFYPMGFEINLSSGTKVTYNNIEKESIRNFYRELYEFMDKQEQLKWATLTKYWLW